VKDSARYIKLIEWSDEDGCFVGQCPGIIGPCCHGDDEAAVYADLCQIVDEWIETMIRRGESLPPPTIGRDLAGKLLADATK
jgi:predicted RNase H-like HicB family nuclease